MEEHEQRIARTMRSAARAAFSALVLGSALLVVGCGSPSVSDVEYVERAKAHQEKRDWAAATVELKNALQKNEDNVEARLLLGQVYLETGEGAAAEKELLRARELGVSAESTAVSLGRALLLQGQFRRVLDELVPLPDMSSRERAELLQVRGDAEFGLGDADVACELYRESTELDSGYIAAYWGLAKCAYREGHADIARSMIDTALKIDGSNAASWVLLGEMERADGNLEAAVEAYTSALQHDPANVDALFNRASLFVLTGKRDEASSDIMKLKQLPGGVSASQFVEAWQHYLAGRTDQALDLVQQVVAARPSYLPAKLLLALTQYDKKAYEQAIQALTEYLQAVPGSLDAKKLLASAYIQTNQPERALGVLRPLVNSGQADAQVLTLAGKAYLRAEDPSSAEQAFEAATELVPTSSALHTDLGLSRLAAGREADAVGALQASSGLDSKDYQADLTLAYYYMSKEQFDEALAAIAVLESKLPDAAGVYNLRGVAYAGKKDLAAARSNFERALQLNPTLTSAAVRLAALDLQENNVPAARARYRGVLENDNSNGPAMIGLAELAALEKNEAQYLEWLQRAATADTAALVPRVMMANHYLGKGEHAKALLVAREAVAGAPESPEALALLGKVQLETGDAASAVSSCSAVTKMLPDSADAWFNLAKASLAAGDERGARTALRRVLEVDADYVKARAALSRLDRRIGNQDEAVKFARKLQQQAPGSPTGFVLEGDEWLSAKSWGQAVQAYEKAVAKRPDATGIGKLHLALVRSGEPAKADAMVVDWLRSHPNEFGVRLYLAQSYTQRQLNDKAIEQYESLSKQAPDNALVLNNLSSLYGEKKDPRAVATAKKAYSLRPEEPALADTLGWLLIQDGEIAPGLELLEKAAAGNPKDPGIRFHLAYALVEAGQKERARNELEQLKQGKLSPDMQQEVSTLLQRLQ